MSTQAPQSAGRSASNRRIAVLIPAAGVGARMRQGAEPTFPSDVRLSAPPSPPSALPTNKVLLPLGGEPLLRHAVRAFHSVAAIATIRIIARRVDFEELDRVFALSQPAERERWARLGPLIEGGTERQDSVRFGLKALAEDPAGPPDWVLVHDGARPLCSPALIERVLAALETHAAAVPVAPIVDTVRQTLYAPQLDAAPLSVEASGGVLNRDALRLCQTPQGFHWATLWDAHTGAAKAGFTGTDDGQLVERLGGPVALVPGERRNLKVTLPDDLALAEWALRHPAWGTLVS